MLLLLWKSLVTYRIGSGLQVEREMKETLIMLNDQQLLCSHIELNWFWYAEGEFNYILNDGLKDFILLD